MSGTGWATPGSVCQENDTNATNKKISGIFFFISVFPFAVFALCAFALKVLQLRVLCFCGFLFASYPTASSARQRPILILLIKPRMAAFQADLPPGDPYPLHIGANVQDAAVANDQRGLLARFNRAEALGDAEQ